VPGPLDDKADELVRRSVRFPAVVPCQQLGEAGQCVQQLLQVVGGDVSESLQLCIRAGQLMGLLGQYLLGPFRLGDLGAQFVVSLSQQLIEYASLFWIFMSQ
jgi:hypothetical protein